MHAHARQHKHANMHAHAHKTTYTVYLSLGSNRTHARSEIELFYDALAGFHGPLSYAMGPRKTKEMFPQLKPVNYSAVYCESMHNDARTGTSIALTAATRGVEMLVQSVVFACHVERGTLSLATCTL